LDALKNSLKFALSEQMYNFKLIYNGLVMPESNQRFFFDYAKPKKLRNWQSVVFAQESVAFIVESVRSA
jgi:hypothetical protein